MRNFKFIFILFILISFIYPLPSTAKTDLSFKILLSKKNKGYPEKFQKKLEHPYDISEKVLKKIMKNLYYIEKKGGSGWKKEKRVFTSSFADKASVRIKHALRKARPNQRVVLIKMSSRGETVCDIFVKEETLNFKFDKINGTSEIHHKWQMVPKLAQRYYKPPKNFAFDILKGGRYKDRTWIRISLLEFAEEYQMEVTPGSKGAADTSDEESNRMSKASIESGDTPLNKLERMKSLKAAYDRKLIMRKEYRDKAIKLLKSPTQVKMNLKDELLFLKIFKNEGFISEDYYDQKKKVLLENL